MSNLITIAIISKNTCTFSEIERFAKPLLYNKLSDATRKQKKELLNEYIWGVISDHVKFVDVSVDDLMDYICVNIGQSFGEGDNSNLMFHTEGSYSSSKAYIELVYADYGSIIQTPNEEVDIMNNLGCLFSLKHKVIKNSCIIISNMYDIGSKKHIKLGNVNKDDILRVVRRRFMHTAMLIEQYQVSKIYFQNVNILIGTIFNVDEDQHVNKIPVSHVGYNMVLYFNGEDEYLNESATRINGFYRINGAVIIVCELEESIHSNMSMTDYKNIDKLSYGKIDNRKPKGAEKHDLDDPNDNPLWSKYMIVKTRLKEKIICDKCSKNMNDYVLCNICHRVRYCSIDCMNEDNIDHMGDCISRI